MRVCVYGAGAIGGYLAARLLRGGAEVSMVARGRTLAALHANGLVVKTPREEIKVSPHATDDPATLGAQDLVVVAVKAPALPSIADGLAALMGPATNVAFVMNGIPWWYLQDFGGALAGRRLPGIDSGDRMLNTVGVARTIGGVIFGGCDVVEPGVVHVENAKMRLILGHPDGRRSHALDALANVLRSDDLNLEVTDTIRRGIWTKLQMNICSGLFGCLTGCPPKDTYSDPVCAQAIRTLVDEAGAIAQAMDCATGLTADRVLDGSRNQTHHTSIAQDLENGSAMMEFDATFGAPLALARMLDVPVPLFSLLATLVKVRAQASGAYKDTP